MKTRDLEDLLWRLGLHVSQERGEPPDDALLLAYRRGELGPEERRRVERRLAADPAARARLAELAGRPPAAGQAEPPPEVRERVLEAFAAAPRASRRTRPPHRHSGRGRWLAAAAVLALAAGVAALAVYRQLIPPALPADLAYQVAVTGLAPSRSGEPAPGPAEALPDTVLRIAASPVRGAVEAVEIGLYRRRGDRLERVPPGPRLRRTAERGAVLFEARAADLLGERPGVHQLYVVVARPGDLPAEIETGPGDPVESLAGGDRRLVHPRTVVLRPPAASSPTEPSDAEEDR